MNMHPTLLAKFEGIQQIPIDVEPLKKRIERSFYVDWETHAREVGVKEANIEKQIGIWIHEATSLIAGRCPKCEAPAACYTKYGAGWVMMRCSSVPPPGTQRPAGGCDFMVDYADVSKAS